MIKRNDLFVEQRHLDAAVLAGDQLGVRVHPLVFGSVKRIRLSEHGAKFPVLVEKLDTRLAALGGYEFTTA